jgi:isopentenyldiphosphate isomerase
MDKNKLNIVNDQDEIIGEESRKKIHEEGLLHREIHVWFYTPKGNLIPQRRGNTDTFPNVLDATVGDHVEMGDSYTDTAIKEVLEETGVMVSEDKLISLGKIKTRFVDFATKRINYSFKLEFAYLFDGDVGDLRVDGSGIVSFEVFKIDKILNVNQLTQEKLNPMFFSPEMISILKEIKTLSLN